MFSESGNLHELQQASLQAIISTLKESSEKFRELHNQVDLAFEERDRERYHSICREEADIIINLPDRIQNELSVVDSELRDLVMEKLSPLVLEEKHLLEKKCYSGIFAIAWPTLNSNITDRNCLEILADKLGEFVE